MRSPTARRAYTLIEVLLVVTILGIAAAMVIPSMGSVGVLRVHAAVRSIVSDITFAQSDAVAYQRQRAIMFDTEANAYAVVEVNGAILDPETDTILSQDLDLPQFGGSRMTEAAFDGEANLVFDELGGPVLEPGSSTPSAGGAIRVEGMGQVFTVNIEPYTGRVTVVREEE